jgi:hypothetical protein
LIGGALNDLFKDFTDHLSGWTVMLGAYVHLLHNCSMDPYNTSFLIARL